MSSIRAIQSSINPGTIMSLHQQAIPTIIALGSLLFLLSCGSGSKSIDGMIDPADFLESTHEAVIEVLIEETDDFFFSRINAVHPSKSNSILVGDMNAKKFYVFDQSGDLIGEVGKEGSGPGEFQQMGSSFLTKSDTLFVMDWSNARITAFTEQSSGRWRHELDVPMVRSPGNFINNFFHFDELGLLGQFSQSFMPGGEQPTDWPTVGPINRSGEKVGDPLASYRPMDSKVNMGTNFVSVFSVPYGRNGIVRQSDNAIHIVDTEFFGALTLSVKGDTLHQFTYPTVDRPVTEDMIMTATNGPDSDYFRAVRDVIPSTRPSFDSFQVDELGNLFFGFTRVTEDTDVWLKFTPSGEYLASFTLPNGTTIHRVRNGRLYTSAGANDFPHAIVYSLREK